MRSVLVSPAWPPERVHNGVVTYVARLAEPMRDEGIDVRIVAQSVDDDVLDAVARDGVVALDAVSNHPAHRAKMFLKRRIDPHDAFLAHKRWQLARALRQLDRERQVDTYEIEEAFGIGRDLVGRAPGKQIIRLHGPWFLCIPALGIDRNALDNVKRVEWEGDSIRRCDGLSSPSKFALDAVRRRYEVDLPNAAVIPNAMPLADDVWTRERATPNSILFIGRFDRLKGADTVIEAYARLRAQRPDVTLTFVGPDRGFPDGTGIEDFVARTLSPEQRAGFTWTGSQTPQQITKMRPTHAVTVVASRYETFPMTALEALAAGSPVVGSRAGGIPEALDWADDLRFEPGDAEGLAARVGALFDAPERAAELGARGREICEERYSPRAVAHATAELHRAVAFG